MSISPSRIEAWLNLGDVYANTGKPDKAMACYFNDYRFSTNRARTYKAMQEFNNQEDNDTIKKAKQGAMDWAIKIYSL